MKFTYIKKNLFLLQWIILISLKKLMNLQDINPYLKRKINYTECTDTLKNPGVGYTSSYWLTAERNKIKYQNHIGSIVLMFVDIGAYSSGRNEEKVDYDFDSSFFDSLRINFENCRKNGATFALRFRYDSTDNANPEPETFDKMLNHITQIKNSGLLEEYKDILMFVESGFVGKWGEQHSGKYCSIANITKLLDFLLDVVPDNIPVTVRTPITIATWFNTTEDKLETIISKKGSRESRVGLYNDGYMGSNTDLGTYKADLREKTINFFYNQMNYTYFGGEFSGNIEYAKQYKTYLPENCIKEMYRSHLSYINANIFKLYNNYTFGKQYDVENVDNSAYYGQTVFKFIRDHLGYRLVLRKSNIPKKVKQGGNFKMNFIIENTGFANPIRKMNSELILEQNGHYMRTELDLDATEFYSCTKKTIELEIKIPGEINTGIWNIFLKIYIGKTDLNTYYMRSIQFANDNIYESNLGANYLGSIKVVSSDDENALTNRKFYQVNSKDKNLTKKDYKLYNINKIIKVDGKKSSYEWTKDLLLAENNNKKIYVTNDDKFLYVMAEIKHNATSPAVNIHISNEDDKTKYIFYYCSNGAIYFSKGNYDNWLYMNNGSVFEFKIPLGERMNMYYGTKLKYIRVFIQDMSKDWINVGDITSGEYTIKYNFNIFTSFKNVILKKGEDYVMDIDISLNDSQFQWQLNGSNISGANNVNYTIKNANNNDIGMYSVIISSQYGEDKIIDICEVNFYKKKNKKSNKILIISLSFICIIIIAIGLFLFLKFRKKREFDTYLDKLTSKGDAKLME